MKNLALLLLTTSLLGLFGSRAFADDTVDASWLRLIKADFETSCAVERVTVGIVVSGNNGYRREQWLMHTCLGDLEYRVEYYPPSAFPDRASPYQIKRINPAGEKSIRSLEPQPFRSSD